MAARCWLLPVQTHSVSAGEGLAQEPLSLQWAEALGVFQQAADWVGLESRKSLWGQFWSAHQRFFKYLCVAAKVRRLVELAREELARDKVRGPRRSLLPWTPALLRAGGHRLPRVGGHRGDQALPSVSVTQARGWRDQK